MIKIGEVAKVPFNWVWRWFSNCVPTPQNSEGLTHVGQPFFIRANTERAIE